MSLISRNLDFFDDMDKVVDTALGQLFSPKPYGLTNAGFQHFSVDVVENKNNYEVIADVPGFETDDITIEHKDGYLSITAERKEENSAEYNNKKWFRKERKYNKFYRSFIMPENVDTSKIDATLKNGVLYIDLPKLEKMPPKISKKISIKS